VNFKLIEDQAISSTALINGSLVGAGYTLNQFAFIYPKFPENKCPVKIVHVVDRSTGGDGIIAKPGINSIEDLARADVKAIGVPRFSVSQTLIEYLLAKSSLNRAQVNAVRRKFKMFNSPEEAGKAFNRGDIDAAATWQPFLAEAESNGGHVLFSTANATNLIIDAMIFRADYIASHRDNVKKFIEGALTAAKNYSTGFTALREMTLVATLTDKQIEEMLMDSTPTNCADNISILDNVGQSLYVDMCTIWATLGQTTDPDAVGEIFDSSIVKELQGQFQDVANNGAKFTEAQRNAAVGKQALLSQRLTINFATGSATIQPESLKNIDDFASVATILNGFIIQIEGNTDSTGNPAVNKQLSLQRAASVAKYLQFTAGVDSSRFKVIGNGQDKPIGDNGTDVGRAANRRTDVYFKLAE
jgi:outer membrane protein OmpA-like peptidoglycan-associated protein